MKKNKKTRIMLVEKSQNLRSVLKNYFEMMNYEVMDFADGESAIKAYKKRGCDICLLDIGLPKKDGYTIMNEIHNITPELPVIFVTARDSKEDRIKGFRAGCDDYVTKPFSTEELLLRLEAVLRRCETHKKREILNKEIIFQMGDQIFNFHEQKLIKGDKESFLTRKEAELLKFLYEHKNKLVPREVITKEIWGDSKAARGRSLDVFISKMRRQITDEHEPKVEIINVHGSGYLLKIME